MPYAQAHDLLQTPDPDLIDLLDALADLSVQYGYIAAMTSQGLREDSEADLVRLLVLIKLIKDRIKKNARPND